MSSGDKDGKAAESNSKPIPMCSNVDSDKTIQTFFDESYLDNQPAKGIRGHYRRSWLQDHLETFVRPLLGFVPQPPTPAEKYFTSEEMTVLKNIWRSVKTESRRLNKPVYLLGRDVWIFEVLARRENFPTVYLPGCSRNSKEYFKHDSHDVKSRVPLDAFVFDTGFEGSIPRALGVSGYKMMSASSNVNECQTFPTLAQARDFAVKVERTPKYLKSGELKRQQIKCGWHTEFSSQTDMCAPFGPFLNPYGSSAEYTLLYTCNWYKKARHYVEDWPGIRCHMGGPIELVQGFNEKDEIVRAAKLTIEIYTDSSPSFVKRHRPVGGMSNADTIKSNKKKHAMLLMLNKSIKPVKTVQKDGFLYHVYDKIGTNKYEQKVQPAYVGKPLRVNESGEIWCSGCVGYGCSIPTPAILLEVKKG